MQRLISMEATGRLDRFEGWREWTAERFEVRSGEPIEVGVDGEALTMDPPLVFTTRPGAFAIRMPRHALGPLAGGGGGTRDAGSTIRELLRIAAGGRCRRERR